MTQTTSHYHIKTCNSKRDPQYPCDCSHPFKTEAMCGQADKFLEEHAAMMGCLNQLREQGELSPYALQEIRKAIRNVTN